MTESCKQLLACEDGEKEITKTTLEEEKCDFQRSSGASAFGRRVSQCFEAKITSDNHSHLYNFTFFCTKMCSRQRSSGCGQRCTNEPGFYETVDWEKDAARCDCLELLRHSQHNIFFFLLFPTFQPKSVETLSRRPPSTPIPVAVNTEIYKIHMPFICLCPF